MPNVSRIGGPLSGERSFDLIRRVIGSRECWTAQGDISFGERTYNMRVLPIPTPLRETGGHLGAVAILSDITQIQVKNRQFAEALDRSRAQVAEISRLRDIAEHASMIDPLTRVANRRALTDACRWAGRCALRDGADRPLIISSRSTTGSAMPSVIGSCGTSPRRAARFSHPRRTFSGSEAKNSCCCSWVNRSRTLLSLLGAVKAAMGRWDGAARKRRRAHHLLGGGLPHARATARPFEELFRPRRCAPLPGQAPVVATGSCISTAFPSMPSLRTGVLRQRPGAGPLSSQHPLPRFGSGDVDRQSDGEHALSRRFADGQRHLTPVIRALMRATGDEVDRAIDRALESVGTFCGADRSYVFPPHGRRGLRQQYP